MFFPIKVTVEPPVAGVLANAGLEGVGLSYDIISDTVPPALYADDTAWDLVCPLPWGVLLRTVDSDVHLVARAPELPARTRYV